MILCDIGNTTYHFKTKKDHFRVDIDKLSTVNLPHDKIYFISVNKKATKQLLKQYPHAINLSKYINFQTKYKGIGIDRVVSCSGVQDGIIIDLGSAITVDIMKKNKHKGGFILPGFNSFKKIYPNISKKLSFTFEKNINLDKIPLNTNSAINYAIFLAIILPILKVYNRYKLPVYLTGGDSKMLKTHLKEIPTKYKKNMIFNSMKKIIKTIKKENRC